MQSQAIPSQPKPSEATSMRDMLIAATKAAQLRPPRCKIPRSFLVGREFLDDQPMDLTEAPTCTLEAMRLPRLRRCPFDVSTLAFTGPINSTSWRDRALDGGLDGYNWKIRFGDSGPFVLKVFWDQEPPPILQYFALQRECQNVAVLQLMQAALAQDDASKGPILVRPHPWDRNQALRNLYAFCDEYRQKALVDRDPTSSKIQITTMPRVRKCYGWIKITGQSLYAQLPSEWRPPSLKIEKIYRQMERDKDYVALVYEYVREGDNDKALIEESLSFFRGAGFSHALISLARNWKHSVLIDMSDIVYAGGYGWKYWRLTAEDVLRAA